jgi:hypothetical protein
MNINDLTVQEYQIYKGICALDPETTADLLEFLQTHTNCDDETFAAGLNELQEKLLEKRKARA